MRTLWIRPFARYCQPFMSRIGFLIGLTAMLGVSASAQAPKAQPAPKTGDAQTFVLDKFGDWQARFSGKGKEKVCYAFSPPKDRKPAALKRDPAHLFVSSRPGDGTRNELGIKLGYAAKTGQDGMLSIGTQRFALLAEGENAFLKNAAQEPQLLEAMKKAADLSVKFSSQRGNETTDRYVLSGFGKALERMAKECP